MTDDPIDFSPLDPTRDEASLARVVQRVTSASASELTRRRASHSVWGQLAAWRSPVVATAAILLTIAFGAMQFAPTDDEVESSIDDFATAIGVDATMSDWLAADSLPSAAQVLFPGEVQ